MKSLLIFAFLFSLNAYSKDTSRANKWLRFYSEIISHKIGLSAAETQQLYKESKWALQRYDQEKLSKKVVLRSLYESNEISWSTWVAILSFSSHCFLSYFYKAQEKYEDDRMMHCWVNCHMSTSCGTSFSVVVSFLKEMVDIPKYIFYNALFYLDLEDIEYTPIFDELVYDMQSNSFGHYCAEPSGLSLVWEWSQYSTEEKCETCCLQFL